MGVYVSNRQRITILNETESQVEIKLDLMNDNDDTIKSLCLTVDKSIIKPE